MERSNMSSLEAAARDSELVVLQVTKDLHAYSSLLHFLPIPRVSWCTLASGCLSVRPYYISILVCRPPSCKGAAHDDRTSLAVRLRHFKKGVDPRSSENERFELVVVSEDSHLKNELGSFSRCRRSECKQLP